jgi:hypothetical protein
MTDYGEFQTIINVQNTHLLIRGVVDGDPKFDPDPPYWLNIKVSPSIKFFGETELYVQKSNITELINELTQMQKKTKGFSSIKCVGWGSYINFEIGKSGELYISGLLNERWDKENNHLTFKFISNSTIIPTLVQTLKRIIAD